MTLQQFIDKAAWEGGILGALEYGLDPNDIVAENEDQEKIREALIGLRAAFKPVEAALLEIEDLFEEAGLVLDA